MLAFPYMPPGHQCLGRIHMITSDKTCPRLVIKGIPGAQDLYEGIRSAKQNTNEFRMEQ